MHGFPSWYLGFGVTPPMVALLSALAINLAPGPWTWLLYAPFLGAGVHMTQRFRLFNTQRWRRVHARSMSIYARLAGQEFDLAHQQVRDFDIARPCRELARFWFPGHSETALDDLIGDGRKAYLAQLLQRCAPVFVQDAAPAHQAAVLAGIARDIEASALGPDAVIVRAIEQQLDIGQAALYFQARLLGTVN